jgi:hypothetical protein
LHGAPASWSGCIAAGAVHCYLPSDIREAYGVDQLPENGFGQTIVLVDSYGSPDAAQELQAFHDTFFPNEPRPTFDLYERGRALSRGGGGARDIGVRGWWPIPISALAVRRGRSDRGCRGSFQSRTGAYALSVESGSTRQAFPCGGALISRTIFTGIRSSCCLRLEFVEDVVGAAADLARDSQHSALAADTRRSLRVQAAVGTVGALRVLRRFDQRPAEHR